MACEVAAAAGVRTLALFHHDPAYDDPTVESLESAARRLFPDVRAAAEGMEICLERPRLVALAKATAESRPAAVEGR
jgi:ribonuclease BN (tRNA processing enzyme)